jgi:glycosyltransferase involved in cell wall biosynthesis
MNNKIAIILTTLYRDDCLYKTIDSIKNVWQDNWKLIILDQDATKQKEEDFWNYNYYSLPNQCGLSYARNFGVQKAHEHYCKYSIITADSIQFTDSMKQISILLPYLSRYSLIGLNMINRAEWECDLELIPNLKFKLYPIDKHPWKSLYIEDGKMLNLWPCDITRNFFIASTESLLKSPWDNNLLLCEHEDWFYRYKQSGFKVVCTRLCSGHYKPDTSDVRYRVLRLKTFEESRILLRKKYNLSSWVEYVKPKEIL